MTAPLCPSTGGALPFASNQLAHSSLNDSAHFDTGMSRFGSHRRINLNALDSSAAEAWKELEAELDLGNSCLLLADQPAMTLSCSFNSATCCSFRGRTNKAVTPAGAHGLPQHGILELQPPVRQTDFSDAPVSPEPGKPSPPPPAPGDARPPLCSPLQNTASAPGFSPSQQVEYSCPPDSKIPEIVSLPAGAPLGEQPAVEEAPSFSTAIPSVVAEETAPPVPVANDGDSTATVMTLMMLAECSGPPIVLHQGSEELGMLTAKWQKEDEDQQVAIKRRMDRLRQLWAIHHPTADDLVQRRATQEEIEVLQTAHEQRVEDRQETIRLLQSMDGKQPP
eukprot:GGOE01006599.1.p1 GENE.GGOE01006599.1~~GGOE01006599.1.p1  ORF type:complete len:336 (+),score=63.46 GGOE01006599.1:126-1133(+)